MIVRTTVVVLVAVLATLPSLASASSLGYNHAWAGSGKATHTFQAQKSANFAYSWHCKATPHYFEVDLKGKTLKRMLLLSSINSAGKDVYKMKLHGTFTLLITTTKNCSWKVSVN